MIKRFYVSMGVAIAALAVGFILLFGWFKIILRIGVRQLFWLMTFQSILLDYFIRFQSLFFAHSSEDLFSFFTIIYCKNSSGCNYPSKVFTHWLMWNACFFVFGNFNMDESLIDTLFLLHSNTMMDCWLIILKYFEMRDIFYP